MYEVCVSSISQIQDAISRGAHRVELCASLDVGGLTPPLFLVEEALALKIPLNVIVRVHSDSFTPSPAQFTQMKDQITQLKQLRVNGVVFGVLTPENKIDTVKNEELAKLAGKMRKTFHMAFDLIENKSEALEKIIKLGFDTVLTRGGCGNAVDNIQQIKELIRQAKGRICVMPGGGITAENRDYIQEQTGAEWMHGTKIMQ
ncbi:Copper_homeostasis protein [Hexamita inflata]|uniref:Copper homeostasis protein cutC homolog n=1 Tax=Hexamita inflata TaxID=28002 RepID=A0AA86NT12_9EUKA|nr:Copper homeostasis protein [Hexamita inflata]